MLQTFSHCYKNQT